MFHPIIFDNLKVVLEGAVYDRDLEGRIVVTSRSDLVDLASFHRLYQIDFRLPVGVPEKREVSAQMQLRTSLADIASEQLEQPLAEHVGCTICIHFLLHLEQITETQTITAVLNDIWGHRPHITQFVGARLDEHRKWEWPPRMLENKVTLDFHRKIDEGNISDLHALVEHAILSLERLSALRLEP